MKQIKCATRYMVILGRTYADGTDQDYAAVNALQAQYKIVPLSAYDKSYTYQTPPVDLKPGFSMTDAPQGDSVLKQVDKTGLAVGRRSDSRCGGNRGGGGRRCRWRRVRQGVYGMRFRWCQTTGGPRGSAIRWQACC
jgi:hypothetical protein